MRFPRIVRHSISFGIAGICIMLGLFLFAPMASARVMQPFPEGATPSGAPPAPVVPHTVVVGGMAGWQVALIVIAVALLTAAVVLLADRVRFAHRAGGAGRISVSV